MSDGAASGAQPALDALDAINERFYRLHAGSFSQTRQAIWNGWKRVLAEVDDSVVHSRRRSLLDVACGNGRLMEAMNAERFRYSGIERSLALLRRAQVRAANLAMPTGALVAMNLLNDDWPLRTKFDVVCAFGLLHHVPGSARRSRLLSQLARYVAPQGLIAVSFWQFAELRALRERAIDPKHLVETGLLEDSLRSQLEEGDAFLPWGECDDLSAVLREHRLRFSHSTSDAEIEHLVAQAFPESAWHQRARFHDDGRTGRLNAYVVVQRA